MVEWLNLPVGAVRRGFGDITTGAPLIMPRSSPLWIGRPGRNEVSRKRSRRATCGEHQLLCRLLGVFLAFVDTRDLMLGPRLVLDGFWEAWVTLAIARHVQPGSWCVDVGANHGYYTLLMAAACGPAASSLASRTRS